MSLIIPKFSGLSILLLYHHSGKRSMCSTSAFCCHLLQEASWLSGVSSLHSLPFTSKVPRKEAPVMGMFLTDLLWRPCRRRCHLSLPLLSMEFILFLWKLLTDKWEKLILFFTEAVFICFGKKSSYHRIVYVGMEL